MSIGFSSRPYGGFSNASFLEARKQLRGVSDCDTLMPLGYYRGCFRAGKFGLAEIEAAVDELVEDQIPGAESLCANAIYQTLTASATSTVDEADDGGSGPTRQLRSLSQYYDRFTGETWTEKIHAEIAKYCAAHYDEGQAGWASPWKHLSLYQAWRAAARHDRTVEVLGLKNFRQFVASLPSEPEAAIEILLKEIDVPRAAWKEYLPCTALNLPGWSAWTKFQTDQARKQGVERQDFTGLLAMRLAYDVALSRGFDFRADYSSAGFDQRPSNGYTSETLVRFTLLRANEIGWRKRVLRDMQWRATGPDDARDGPVAAQQRQDWLSDPSRA